MKNTYLMWLSILLMPIMGFAANQAGPVALSPLSNVVQGASTAGLPPNDEVFRNNGWVASVDVMMGEYINSATISHDRAPRYEIAVEREHNLGVANHAGQNDRAASWIFADW